MCDYDTVDVVDAHLASSSDDSRLPVTSSQWNDVVFERLKPVLGKSAVEIAELFQSTVSLLLGSFTLQCMDDVTWAKSDIDVFIPCKNREKTSQDGKWEDLLMSLGGRYTSTGCVSEIEETLTSSKIIMPTGEIVNLVYVNCEWSYEGLFKHVDTFFDLSFCNTAFDGLCMRYYPDTLNKKGWVINANGFIRVNCGRHEDMCMRKMFSYSNLLKYLENQELETGPLRVDFLRAFGMNPLYMLQNRIQKYASRGYTVEGFDSPIVNVEEFEQFQKIMGILNEPMVDVRFTDKKRTRPRPALDVREFCDDLLHEENVRYSKKLKTDYPLAYGMAKAELQGMPSVIETHLIEKISKEIIDKYECGVEDKVSLFNV